jgi:hypothetical protein
MQGPSEESADGMTIRRFSFEEAFSLGWRALKAAYWPLVGSVLVFGLIMLGIWVVEDFANSADPCMGGVVSLAVGLFFTGPLSVGATYLGVRAVRGEAVSPGVLFHAFRADYWGTVVRNLVMGLLGVVVIPFIVPGTIMVWSGVAGGEIILVAGVIAGVVAYIYCYTRYGFALLIGIDERVPRQEKKLEPLSMSWRMTSGLALPIFGLVLVLGLIAFASAVLLVLPLVFFGLPLLFAVYGAAYVQLTNQSGVTAWSGDVCPECGYDLEGLNVATCPECGADLADPRWQGGV